MRAFLAPALAGLAAGGLLLAQEPKPDRPPDVPALIRQLGSPNFADREAATTALGRTLAALGPLAEAARGGDPEVARRAAGALAVLRKRAGADRLKRLPEYARARQVDRFVEAMAAWPDAVSFDDRQLARVLAREVAAWAGREFGADVRNFRFPDVDRHPEFPTPLTTGRDLDTVARGDTIAASLDGTKRRQSGGEYWQFGGGFVSFRRGDGSYFLVNGDIRATEPAPGKGVYRGGLTVCNGDFTAEAYVSAGRAVILAAGDVDFRGHGPQNSLVVAGGDIRFQSADHEEFAVKTRSAFHRREPKLAEFLRFYDCASEGLHVRAEDKTVFVTKVDAGKPFAAAGVQPGDRVVKVNDVPVRSVRELNRLLCRAEVGYPGTAALFLARGDDGVDAVVKLADPPVIAP
jgi:hypothetical protein